MPSWLQAVIALTGVVVMLSQIVARWGGRAQRQDTDGRALERVEGATRQHDVTGATLSSLLTSLADGVSKLDKKLDKLTDDHHETREQSVRLNAERVGDRERIVRLEADNASLRAEMRDMDQRHIDARHDLRNQLNGPNAVTEIVTAIKAQSEATARAADAMAALAARLPKGRA